MKQKLLILLFAAFVLSFTGCSKPEPEQPDNPEQPEQPEQPGQPDDPDQPQQTDFVSGFLEAKFWADYFQCGKHNYTVYMGTAEHYGSYVTGPGYLVALSLMVDAVEDPMKAGMVAGTFTFDPKNTLEPNTIVGEEMMVCLYEEKKDGNGYMNEIKYKVQDARLEIKEVGENYEVLLEIAMEDGQQMTWTYAGEADYQNSFAEMYPDEISENKEFECGYGEMSNEGGGLYKLDLMSGGDPYADMSWANRDRMNIYIQTEDENQLPAGTYEVMADGTGSYVIAGEYIVEGSSGYSAGSHYFFMDGATYEAVYGFFVSGTVTISYEGEVADIKVDVKNPHGLTIKSTYHGVLK